MNRGRRYSTGVRERPVRLVAEQAERYDSEWATLTPISERNGCTEEPLRKWVRQAQRDGGTRVGLTTQERQRVKELEGENRGLRRANGIQRKASAYLAQAELDRRPK